MRFLIIGIHGLFAVALTFWVYLTLSNAIESQSSLGEWLSINGMASVLYTGVPFLLVVLISYIKAYPSDRSFVFSKSSSFLYVACYMSFALMLLMHLGPTALRILLTVFHVVMLAFLIKKAAR